MHAQKTINSCTFYPLSTSISVIHIILDKSVSPITLVLPIKITRLYFHMTCCKWEALRMHLNIPYTHKMD